jgi:hypothetical protein
MACPAVNWVMDTESRDGLDDLQLDGTQVSVARFKNPAEALAYWLSRPVEERLREVERLRRVEYGEEAVTGRIQKILEVVRLEDL